MKIPHKVSICIVFFCFVHNSFAHGNARVIVPKYRDQYSESVKQLEAGKKDIIFKEFRESFLESEQFKAASSYNPDLETLRTEMYNKMRESKPTEIIDVAQKMLSNDYTDMEAHKILQQTYKILGDISNQNKYHDIEIGLLKSIVNNGDGKSCQTAWPVIQLAEEYFILKIIGAELLKQSVDNTEGLCDKMEVKTAEGNTVRYFEISNVFKGYNKRGIH